MPEQFDFSDAVNPFESQSQAFDFSDAVNPFGEVTGPPTALANNEETAQQNTALDLEKEDQPGVAKHMLGQFAQGGSGVVSNLIKSVALNVSAPDQELLESMEAMHKNEELTGYMNGLDHPDRSPVAQKSLVLEPIDSVKQMYFQFQSPEKQKKIIDEMRAETDEVRSSTFYKMGDEFDKWVKENTYNNPEIAERGGIAGFFQNDVPQGFGSMLAFILPAALSRGQLSRVAPGMTAAEATAVGAGIPGALSNQAAQFDQALADGATITEAFEVADKSQIIGASEGLPLLGFLDRIDDASGGAVKKSIRSILQQGTEEAIQEGSVEIANAIARHSTYDTDESAWEIAGDAGKSSAVGFTTGAILETLVQVLTPGRQRVQTVDPNLSEDSEADADFTEPTPQLEAPNQINVPPTGPEQVRRPNANNGMDGSFPYDQAIDLTGASNEIVAEEAQEETAPTIDDQISALEEIVKQDQAAATETQRQQALNPTVDDLSYDAPVDQVPPPAVEAAPSAPVQQKAEVTAPEKPKPAKAETVDTGYPEILSKTKRAYLNKKANEIGLKPGSPGYDQAFESLSQEYETEMDIAQASLPFEKFNELNSESPESLNRQAYDNLRVAHGIQGEIVKEAKAEAKPEPKQKAEPKAFKPVTAKYAKEQSLIRDESEIDEYNALVEEFDKGQGSNIVALRNAKNITEKEGSLPTKTKTELDSVGVESKANEAATSPTNELPAPTEAQIEAGNYKKGHVKVNGLDITIENPKGSKRSGKDAGGKKWEVEMESHYGYIKRTEGADGEHVDVFVGENTDSDRVFVVDQVNKDGSFDEHKVMIGFDSKTKAREAYRRNYTKDFKVGPITQMSVDEFKTWLKTDTTTPIQEKTKPAKAKPTVSKNTIFTDEAAEKARAILKAKLGQIGSGIDPEMMQAGITLAGNHIEKGARTFSAYSKAMIEEFGEAIKPYLRSFYEAVRHYPSFDSTGMTPTSEVEQASAEGGSLSEFIESRATSLRNNNDIKKALTEFYGKAPTEQQIKLGQEALELALVKEARAIAAKGKSTEETFRALLNLYQNQPLLNSRTSTSMKNQAYSTPAPLAYLASKLSGIDSKAKVYEPTAGNGMLLIDTDPANATVNELNADRVKALQDLGFTVTSNDATEYTLSKGHDAVIMNPPFGGLPDGPMKYDGYTIKKIDHLIAAKALEAMNDDGRATLIIGANRKPHTIAAGDETFFNWLYSHYNVVDHFEVDGDLYNRQGAGWPVVVISVNGRVKSKQLSPEAGAIERIRNWDEVYDHTRDILDSKGFRSKPERASSPVPDAEQQPGDGAELPLPTDGQVATNDRERAKTAPSKRDNATVVADRSKPSRSERPAGNRADTNSKRDTVTDDKQGGVSAESTDRLQRPKGNEAVGSSNDNKPSSTNSHGKPVEPGSDYQVNYQPASAGFNDAVLVPVNMRSAIDTALQDLQSEVGNVDQYLVDKLNYSSVEEMHKGFMGLQADAVAAFIYNTEKKNKGVIIADQTGVGKGRQAAGVIRYALQNGKIPVFITVKPNLFTDMYNDAADIGVDNLRPFIMNLGESVKGKKGKALFKTTSNDRKLGLGAMEQGEMPPNANAIFLTYSQANLESSQQRKAINALRMAKGKDVIFIMDEAHNAAGETVKIKKVKGVTQKTTTVAGFFQSQIANNPVLYLSATYAKRPDNMPLYFRTDLSDSVDKPADLIEAAQAGGEALQTVISNMLAQSGQLWRRERSFDGIEIKTVVNSSNRDRDIKLFDQVAKGLRSIVTADNLFETWMKTDDGKSVIGSLDIPGGRLMDAGGGVESKAGHSPFTSVIHNYVRQLLLALKADWIIDEAIATHKAGKKPVIALENTMESFLKESIENGEVKVGDAWEGDYRSILIKALHRTHRISVKNDMGDTERVEVPLSMMDPLVQSAYDKAEEQINSLGLDEVPIMYIDYIRHALEKAGVRTSEITGRSYRMDYSTPEPTVIKRDPVEKKDRRGTVDKFNNGEIDALILNTAGSTGLSIHASEKFADQKPRHMLVAQAMLDINILMQMLGRINRTGQLELPEYSLMGLDLPSEKRPLAVANRKMRSLNANTSANTDSDTSLDAPDILNKFGDQVASEYLADNPDLARDLRMSGSESGAEPGFAMKFTGRLAMQPVKVQERAYRDVEATYKELIEFLDKTGQNDLKTETLDLDAKIVSSEVVYEGKATDSIFGGNTTIHMVDVKRIGKPPTGDMVFDEINLSLDGRTPEDVAKQVIAKNSASIEAEINRQNDKITTLRDNPDTKPAVLEAQIKSRDKLVENWSSFQYMVNHRFKVGSASLLDIGDDVVVGVVTKVVNKNAAKSLALSKVKVTFAVNSPAGFITLPASKLAASGDIFKESRPGDFTSKEMLDKQFDEKLAAEAREMRHIATGNLIGGFSKLGKGRVVNFVGGNGKSYLGILLPRNYSKSEKAEFEPIAVRDPEMLRKYLQAAAKDRILGATGIRSAPPLVQVRFDGEEVSVMVPKKADAMSDKVKFDTELHSIMGAEFAGRGQQMEAVADAGKLDAIINHLLANEIPLFVPAAGESLLVEMGFKRSVAVKSFDDSKSEDKDLLYTGKSDLFDKPKVETKRQNYEDISSEQSYTNVDEQKTETSQTPNKTPISLRSGVVSASSAPKGFTKEGKAKLIGAKISSPEQLATLAQIYRNPEYETFRIFFTKGDVVVAQTGISARLPGQTEMFLGSNEEGMAHYQSIMQNAGADGYYLLHNHPPGDPDPSTSDLRATEFFSRELPGFKKHVIINSDMYGVISIKQMVRGKVATGETIAKKFPLTYDSADISIPHPIIGERIRSPESAARIAKEVQQNKNYAVAVGFGVDGVRGIMEIPHDMLANKNKFAAHIRRFGRHIGTQQIILTNVPKNYRADAQTAIKTDLLYDALIDDQSVLADMASKATPRANFRNAEYSFGQKIEQKTAYLESKKAEYEESNFSRQNREFREEHKTIWSKAKTFYRRQFMPGGLLPKDVFDDKIERDSELGAVEFDIGHLVGSLENIVKADYGKSFDNLTDAELNKLQAALTGKIDTSLPKNTLTAIVAMRQYIDKLSSAYVGDLQREIDALNDEESAESIAKAQLLETIVNNMGTYAHRSYRAFDDANWYKNVPDNVLDAAREYFTEQYEEQGMSRPEALQRAEVTMHEIVKNGTAYDNMESFIRESKLGAKDLSTLKRRKQIPPQIRALLGEYIDPRINFAKSATKMSRLVFNQRFLNKLRENGLGVFLFEGDDRPADATVQIAGEKSDVYAPLNGLWTFPETDQALRDALGKEDFGKFMRFVIRMNGMVKYGKTVLSPTTAARNWQSAMFFTIANGHFDLRHVSKSISGFKEYMSHKGKPEKLAYLRKLKKLGVVYDTPYAGEMIRLLEDSKIDELLQSKSGSLLKFFRGANKFATKAYQYGDDFWKIIGFENEKASLIKTGMSEVAAEKEAAERIRNTYPTYSMVGRGINWLRRFPLAGTFVSFPAEIIRTSFHIIRYAAKDIATPGRRALGLKRTTGIAIASSFAYALQEISKAWWGMDDEEEEAVRLLAAPWEKNSNLMFIGRDEQGQLQYFDMSFLDPYNYWKKPITAVTREQPWEDAAVDAAGEMLSPFLGTDITAGTIFEILANKKDTGATVYDENASPIDQTVEIADHLRKNLQPGIASNVERTWRAMNEEYKSSGQRYDMGDEVAAWVGWRARTLEPKTALYYRSFDFKDAKASATKVLNKVLRDANSVSNSDIDKAYARATRQSDEAFREMALVVAASQKNGMTRQDVIKVLSRAKLSEIDIAALLKGQAPAVTISVGSAESTIANTKTIYGEEVKDKVRDRYLYAIRLQKAARRERREAR